LHSVLSTHRGGGFWRGILRTRGGSGFRCSVSGIQSSRGGGDGLGNGSGVMGNFLSTSRR
jgi:hypothetical protein